MSNTQINSPAFKPPEAEPRVLVRASAICKQFIGVTALDGVDFELMAGEIHAFIGENGAGKSTLIKILAGVHQPDGGQIEIRGKPVTITNPHAAQKLGLAFIFQELSVVNGLSVAENIVLGQEPRKGPFFDLKQARKDAHEVLDKIGFGHVDPAAMVATLSVAEKQGVMIGRALHLKADVIVMDEATSSLDADEVEHLFQLMRSLRAAGKGIIFVSHRLHEIFQIADRVTVYKDGKLVGTRPISQLSEWELARMMVGRQVTMRFPAKTRQPGEVVLKVEHLENRHLHDISFELHAGEILAVAGLVGSGRTELLRALFGADPIERGQVFSNHQVLDLQSVDRAIRAGMALVPEDRRHQGIVGRQSVMTNLLMIWSQFLPLRRMKDKNEKAVATELVEQLHIKTPSLYQTISYLSGGNQQKAVVGKWLAVRSKVLLLDEPTRGIDVGAKLEMYLLIDRLAREGMAVIMVSSELPEVLGMADRILVMRAGRIAGELGSDASEEEIIAIAMLTQKAAA